MLRTLREGRSIYMCPGGVADITNRKHEIKKRTGFLRIAKEANVPVVPIWCPDERSYYEHWSPLGGLLKPILGFEIPILIIGRWWCPILPRAVEKSRICVGPPITWDDGKSLEEASAEFWGALVKLQREGDTAG